MIIDTNYQTGSSPATGLTNYLSKDGQEIRDHTGRELDDDEIEQFHERAAENGFSRQIVMAPDRHMTADELDRAARGTMNEWTADHTTTEYVYSVHEDTETPHVHVAATATQDSRDLFMQEDDIRELRDDIAADHFQDHSLDRQQDQMIEQGRGDDLEAEQQTDQLILAGSNQQDEQDQDAENYAIYAAAVGELASLTTPETLPISIAAEMYRDRNRRDRENDHDRDRDRQR
jgi:hypothetical protein